MSRHLSTCNISSKSMHAFLSNLANRQTDKRGQTHLLPPLLEVKIVIVMIVIVIQHLGLTELRCSDGD